MKNIHMKKKNSFSKILSLLIAVVMLLTLPGFSTLADTDSTTSSTASSASEDTTDVATADTAAAAAKSNANSTLVGSSDTSVSAVADESYRIYYSQIETVNHTGSSDFSAANTAWNNINSNGKVYINVGGTDKTSGTVAQMSDTGLTLTSNGTAYKVYYYDIPTTTTSLYFLCENTTTATGIKTRTNPVTLTWNSGKLASYTTAVSGTSTKTDVTLTSNNCFYADNPNSSDWFYQVKSTSFNPVSAITLTDTAVATNETATIAATITPSWITADDLIWSTEDSSVATVAEGGVVTGVTDGTATITATYGDVTASCRVTVSSKPSISIAPNPASVKVGSTMDFTATITPDAYKDSTISWSVENSSIATIESTMGTVKGVKAGTTTVTASFTADGTTYSGYATLTVTDAPSTVSSISLDPTAATIQVGKTQQLTATVTPTGTSSVNWSSNNKSVATVDQNGLVTGIKAGTATITATAEEDSNITATAKITVTQSTTLYYLAPVSWSGVWVYFYKDDNHYNAQKAPTAAMTKLDASNYLVDGSAIDTSKYNLYAITVPDTYAYYAIFSSASGAWTNQDPAAKAGGRETAPGGANGYYNGNGTAVLVTRKAPTSIDVTPEKETIASNQTVQLTATATYSDASTEDISGTVTWTSSATDVATVSSNGLVTAVGEGTVTITATVPGSNVSDTATITVKNAAPTSISLTPAENTLLVGTTATLTPSYKPANVNASLVNLIWNSSDENVATVDSDGVVTAVGKGTATITATVKGTSVKATAKVTVSENSGRIYYYAALSKLSYERTPAGNVDRPRSIPVADQPVYAYVWNGSDADKGQLISMTKLGSTSGNGMTYADGDIYYADDVVGKYEHITFANGDKVTGKNLYGYGEGTAALDIPKDVTNPCFYAGSGDDSVYSSAVGMRPGYWASLFTVFDPEKVSGSDPVYVASGKKPATDTYNRGNGEAPITYVSSTLYDYYSDYELNGKEVSKNNNSYDQVSQRNWVTFREFDQALSDYYKKTGKTAWKDLAPIYTGHFQPDYLKGTLFRTVADTLNLYGWSSSGDDYRKFMATENSGIDINGGEGMYAKASQGLVANTLDGYQDGSLGTGTLLTNDGSASLPHFNRQFLEGQNSKNAILGSVYENVAFPFTQEKDPYYKDVSYYTFDSARESVYLRKDQTTGEGYLEDVGTDAKSMNVNSNSATSDISTTYGYFPFNEDSISKNAKTYDYGFGTKLEFQFRLDKNGDVKSAYGPDGEAPTIFKFSGDDDVWVFIDGKLVLDLGGSHGQVQGAINFSSDLSGTAQYPSPVKGTPVKATVPANSVWVSDTKATAGTSTPYDLSSLNLQDGKKHTLTLYYMERGMWESNMMIQFNMSIEKTLTVKKDWKNYDGSDLADSKKTTVYAAVKRSLPNGTSEFVNLTDSKATNGSQYLIPLTSANQWTQTFSVEEYKYGAVKEEANKYTYYVYEVQVDPAGNPVYKDNYPALYQDGQKMTLSGTTYQVSGTGEVTGAAGTITNTRQKGSGVTIKKEWSGITSDAMKPANIYVVLYETTAAGVTQKVTKNASGTAIGNDNGVITLNSGNNWTASVEDLKASSSYTFKEVTDNTGATVVSDGGTIELTGTSGNKYTYTVSGGDVTNGSATITNTFSAPKTSVSITKSWVDESSNALTDDLPDTVYVKLKRTGTVDGNSVTQYRQSNGTFTTDESLAGTIELDKGASWTATISGLDVYADIVNQTDWTYSVYGETSGTSTESGKLISINGIQYVVSYGDAAASADKNVALTATNTKLPQTSLTVEKQWQNMDGKTSDEITKDHTETISVYLKRFTKDSSGKEANVGYYKVSGEVVSFVGSQKDATAISLTKENSYKATVSGLDEYLASVDDKGNVTKTPYNFVLVSESGSWSTTSSTASTTSSTSSTDSTAGTTSSADTSSGSASESNGKITLNGKTYIVTYGDSAASTDTSPTVTVTNKYSPVFTLPGTGGRGRNILLGIPGGAAVLAAVLYWNIRKTRRRKFGKE
ncbi:MAG: Ig-like domain-containing protein [Chordicoccus sp.]